MSCIRIQKNLLKSPRPSADRQNMNNKPTRRRGRTDDQALDAILADITALPDPPDDDLKDDLDAGRDYG